MLACRPVANHLIWARDRNLVRAAFSPSAKGNAAPIVHVLPVSILIISCAPQTRAAFLVVAEADDLGRPVLAHGEEGALPRRRG